jgi:hypothetical protein
MFVGDYVLRDLALTQRLISPGPLSYLFEVLVS